MSSETDPMQEKHFDEQVSLRLFPLHTVLFPGMQLPLHIFEERYRLMVGECIERKASFGVVLIESGREVGGPASFFSIGTSARIREVERLPDGRMNVLVVGERRFRITSIVQHIPYLIAQVSFLPIPECRASTEEIARTLRHIEREYSRYDRLMALVTPDRKASSPPSHSPTELAYFVASMVESDDREKQAFLSENRLENLLEHERRLLEQQNYQQGALLAARHLLERRRETDGEMPASFRLN